jgi:hypothetical protein
MGDMERWAQQAADRIAAAGELPQCNAQAASCVCGENAGHDGPHRCLYEKCRGEWLGNFDGDDFVSVKFPNASGLGPMFDWVFDL